MSAAFIVDCSLAMTWCFRDEATPPSAAIQDRLEHETALVPGHWFLEVANVLAFAEKKKRVTVATTAKFLSHLAQLDLEVAEDVPSRAFDHVLPLCRAHGLTSYDAAYLDLAVRRGLPLASLDDDLRAAAGSLGVVVLGK